MNRILLRAARLIVAPDREWQVINDEGPRPLALARYVLPLSLIPAAGWALGLWLFGNVTGVGRNAGISGVGEILYGGLLASAGVVLWILLSAGSMLAVARLFGGARDWLRALQVAAYSATPALIAGLLLIQPDLMSILIIAFFYSLYLQYLGVRHLLQVKERDAAEYVALSTILLLVSSTGIGSLGGWLGVL